MSRANGPRNGLGKSMIAGSLKRLTRNGRTAANESGPPRFINTTATRAISPGGDRFGEQASERRDILGRRFRQHAVAEVEHKAAAAKRLAQLSRSGFERGAAGNQQHRVEITLNCGKRLQPLADMTGGDHRIKPDPIDPRLGDVPLVEETRAARKADDRMIWKALFQARDDNARRFDDPPLESRFRQDPCPGVEE